MPPVSEEGAIEDAGRKSPWSPLRRLGLGHLVMVLLHVANLLKAKGVFGAENDLVVKGFLYNVWGFGQDGAVQGRYTHPISALYSPQD